MGGFGRLWRDHRGLTLAFAAASLVALVFALRLAVSAVYWSGHRDAELRGWMTIGYVAHAWGVDRAALAAAVGVEPGGRRRLTLAEIAAETGRPLPEVEAALAVAIAAERAGQDR